MPRLPPGRIDEVLSQLRGASSPGFDFFALVVLSTVICTFGLMTDSAAVIIGGMLVAPLMSPILAVSAASVVGERRLFGSALMAFVEGMLLAVALSAVMAWLARRVPFGLLDSLPREVLARTRPSPLDLGVALAGGAAAAYALAQPELSAALPGVAIATALLPPLCTVGIGLAIGQRPIATGAALLFATNFVAIAFAGIATFAAVGFNPMGPSRARRTLFAAACLVLIIAVPLVGLTTRFVRELRAGRVLEQAIDAEVARLPGAQLVEVEQSRQGRALHLDVTIRSPERPTYESVVSFQEGLARRLQERVALVLTHVPVTRLDPLNPPPRVTPRATPPAGLNPAPAPVPTPTSVPTPTPSLPVTARGYP